MYPSSPPSFGLSLNYFRDSLLQSEKWLEVPQMSLSLLFNSLLIDNSVSILTGSWLYVDLIFSVTRVSFRCSDNLKSQTLPLQQNCPVITDLSKSLSFYFATFFFPSFWWTKCWGLHSFYLNYLDKLKAIAA